jgi:acetyl esterase/lipase
MDLSEAYENGAFIPGAADYPPRWAAAAAAFRAACGARAQLDLPYGSGTRQRFDLFVPEGAAAGLMVFVHGGYWRRFDKSSWSHLASGALVRGWAVAMPSYTLAPEARIAGITREIALATCAAASRVAGPLVLTGHSAGGHLVARMRSQGVLQGEVAARVGRIVPISPVADLRPLMQTEMNGDLRIDAEEALAESPTLLRDLHDIPTHIWVGAEERPAFLDQARGLSAAWDAPLTVDPERHHFDVIEGLELAQSPLMSAALANAT